MSRGSPAAGVPVFALSIALAVLVLDQVTKLLALDGLGTGTVIEVTSFFNLVLVWNSGVSFGLFQGWGEAGRWLLAGFSGLVAIGLLVWIWREPRLPMRLALALVLSGAVGNLIDRVRFGAVVDFLDFHLAGHHWPAFNVADSAIVAGAVLLLVDSLFFAAASPDDGSAGVRSTADGRADDRGGGNGR